MNGVIKNIFRVAVGNISTIVAGIVVGFIIPKILTVYGYGMYKTFTLYVTYIGFCSLGIIDGIVLKYGGIDYNKIDKKLFRSFFKWYVLVNGLFAIIIIVSSFFIESSAKRFIFRMLGVNIIIVNITGYYQQISQITQRFKEFSLRKVIQSMLSIIGVIITAFLYYLFSEVDFKLYVLIIVLTNLLLTIWYLYTYKDISFGTSLTLTETFPVVRNIIITGFPLLISNLLSTLVLTIDRQFVNVKFNTEVYAVYAFAYNMLALVTVAMSAISTVLYPTLKRSSSKRIEDLFPTLIEIVEMFIFLIIAIYFPLAVFVDWFLPKYEDSIQIFRIIFPGLAMSSPISIVMHNYYKTLGKSTEYFIKSVIILIVSIIANYFAYYIFRTPESISAASIITIAIWYIISEELFVKYYKYKPAKNLVYIGIMTIMFYITSILNAWIGMIAYLIIYIATTIIMFKNDFESIKKIILKKI